MTTGLPPPKPIVRRGYDTGRRTNPDPWLSVRHQPIAGSRDPEVPEHANDDIALLGEWSLIVVPDELPDPLESRIELQRRHQTFAAMFR